MHQATAMNIDLTTFSFEIDDRFLGRHTRFEAGSVWVPPLDAGQQHPIFNFGLSEVDDFDDFDANPGFADDYEGRVRTYFDGKRSMVIDFEDSEREIGGRRVLVRTSTYRQRSASGQDSHVFALFANIRLDDHFVQEFSADCPLEQRGEYEPIFWAAIESYRFKGNARAAIEAQNAALAEWGERFERLVGSLEKAPVEDALPPQSETPMRAFKVPPGGAEAVRIDRHQVEIDSTSWTIPRFSGLLTGAVSVRFAVPTSAIDAGLLSAYADSGEAKISVSASGVYDPGGPRGHFRIQEGRSPTDAIEVRLDGFAVGLAFEGHLEFGDGWFSLIGHLGIGYDPTVRFEVEVSTDLDPTLLDWNHYRFTTPDELAGANPALVRHVQLVGLDEGHDLAALARCTGLQTVFLRHRNWGDPRPIVIPDEVFGFEALTRLTIQSIALQEIPDSIGRLVSLERLALSRCRLADTPEALWALPKLRWLILDHNELDAVPDRIELPALATVDLSWNRLRRLPDTLFDQPMLTGLRLDANPWEELPAAANDPRFDIGLGIDDKHRLLDFEYRGADGTGVAAWDDDAYHARSDPALAAVVDEVIDTGRIGADHAEALRFLAKRAIALRIDGEDDYSRPGNHRVGGMPDLPPTIPYPRFTREGASTPYEFICQLDCGALAEHQDYLPRSGFLYFFLSTIHDLYGGDQAQAAHVIWFDGSSHDLVPGDDLRIPADEYFEMSSDSYEVRRLSAAAMVSPPEWYAARQNGHLFRGPADLLATAHDFVDQRAYEAFTEPLQERYPFDLAVGSYGFTQHEDPEHQASLARKGRPEDWVILLHVKSVLDMQWGDAGDLFFVAHKSDIARSDFSAVFCTNESS